MAELLKISGTSNAIFQIENTDATIDICNIPTILSSTAYSELSNDYHLGITFSLEALKASVNLSKSLAEAPFPGIKSSDSTPAKLSKFAAMLKEHPKIGLELLLNDKVPGEIQFQNRGMPTQSELRYPYLGTGYIKLLGEGDRLQARLKDYGSGLLKEDDYIAITGDYSLVIDGTKKNDIA